MSAIKKDNLATRSLSEPELIELLRIMDATSQNHSSRDRRRHARHPHTSHHNYIKVIQPGGGTTERLVTVRDLCAGGLAMLYPGYLHNGSLLQIELQKRLGGKEVVCGHVAYCRHLHAAWHAVGIQFNEVIFPQLFLAQSGRSSFGETESVKVDISRLKGSVLILDDQSMDRGLFVHLLKGSSLRVTEAATTEEALALIVRSTVTGQEKSLQTVEPFNLVVCDLNLGDVHGETAISQIREKGYRGPLMVLTAETTPERLTAAMSAGGTSAFQKPYTAEKLHAAIAAQLGAGCVAIDDPICSPLSTDPQNRILVERYVAQVRTMAAELRKAVSGGNLAQARVLCLSLKGTGTGYGFAQLTTVATATVASLDSSNSVGESAMDLQRLDVICSRVSAADPSQQNRVDK